MGCENRLFVAYKPSRLSSNGWLGHIKRRYGVKKAGFSGTLDPFAKGTMLVAFGQYTRLFRFLKKSPKTYRATLWLGATGPTLDIESVTDIAPTPPLDEGFVRETVASFCGKFSYVPPSFSAKKINGRRAYDLARRGKEVVLEPVTSTIYSVSLVHYRHPFITFEATVSEGTYIRSLGEAIAKKLGFAGILSALERLREGDFVYQNERPLDPIAHLTTRFNRYMGNQEDLLAGRPLKVSRLLHREPGLYHLLFDPYFAIIEVDADRPAAGYLLNKVKRCSY